MPMEKKTNKEKRDTEVSVAKRVKSVALETEGVYDLNRSVKAVFDETTLVLDVFPILAYGVNIPQVAWDIQENVKRAIESEFPYSVKAVNIYVQGIHVPD